jgi:histidinol dehydrogenase
MIKILKVNSFKEFEAMNVTARSEGIVYEKMDYVRGIVNEVKKRGDEALIEYTKKFDGVDADKVGIKVSKEEIDEAFLRVEPEYIKAIENAIANLEKYHNEQIPKDYIVNMDNGIELGRKWVAIDTVGLYVPGGRAPYVTACYMLGTPARVAGCKRRIACVPPDKTTGKINPYVLVSAALSGITAVYKVGGAQAIAAMAYGTETIPKVGKIFGPGNVYVTAAKLLVYGNVDIDAPAGPSEALIIADGSANYKYVASDILSQAEHDTDSAAILLTISESYAKEVYQEVLQQMETLPRKDIINASFTKFGSIVVCPSIDICIEIANYYAPEHIQIITKDSKGDAEKIVNSGSVCIGEYSPIAAGDYLSGVNNVIPTGGGTKMFSPVHVEGFMKCYQTQYITKDGLSNMSENLRIISGVEGFDAHYNSVKVRL